MSQPSSTPSFTATVLTLYPEMFPGPLGASLAGSALKSGLWALKTLDIRRFATDKHRSVDDSPSGGGAGMILRPDVVGHAIEAAMTEYPAHPVLVMTPRGKPLTQNRVRQLAAGSGVSIVCGRFEGFDERLFEHYPLEPVSVGDYVLSGGEPAALVILDAVVRLLPGVMGKPQSGEDESFGSDDQGYLLEYPHYTRPRDWEGRMIPDILQSGDHAKIAAWRRQKAEEHTRLWRPDLWEQYLASKVRMSPSGTQ